MGVLSCGMVSTLQTCDCTAVYQRGELVPRERDNFTCHFCGTVMETFTGTTGRHYRLLAGPMLPPKAVA
jgi:hypothetical protein